MKLGRVVGTVVASRKDEKLVGLRLAMVQDLFGTYGAAQDELTFKFASDVNVDQTTEIARMEKMLTAFSLEHRAQ